jgi:hypothetical protein
MEKTILRPSGGGSSLVAVVGGFLLVCGVVLFALSSAGLTEAPASAEDKVLSEVRAAMVAIEQSSTALETSNYGKAAELNQSARDRLAAVVIVLTD